MALWQVKKSVTDLDKTLNTNKSKVSKASDSVNAIRLPFSKVSSLLQLLRQMTIDGAYCIYHTKRV